MRRTYLPHMARYCTSMCSALAVEAVATSQDDAIQLGGGQAPHHSLADEIWKGQRVGDLEGRVVARLAAATGIERWRPFMSLDHVREHLSADVDRRLARQSHYPITTSTAAPKAP